jgi:hypothetical protein
LTTGAAGPPTFEYGTLAAAGVPAVLVISETKLGTPDPASNFQPDGTITGVSSFNLTIQDTSTQTVYTPLLAEVAQLTSASGAVTVANADNGQTAAGADWDYSSKIGSDGVLSPGEVSGTRNLSFNNPNNETFTVTLNIVGNLARSSSSAGSSPQARRAARRSSDTSSASAASNAGLGSVTSLVFQITYNPLLNTVTIQQVSP